MAEQGNVLEIIGRVTTIFLSDFNEEPKDGSYLDAVTDLANRIASELMEAADNDPKQASPEHPDQPGGTEDRTDKPE
ncbi:MAG: hypothetical protein V7635_209 [Arthrobacter sp.]|jgi:hypothetical protein